MLLKKFGNLKAMLNASASGPVPKNVAINTINNNEMNFLQRNEV
jgi:hypothetical protein